MNKKKVYELYHKAIIQSKSCEDVLYRFANLVEKEVRTKEGK